MPEVDRRLGEVRVLVPTGLGVNCEVETAEAFRRVGATADRVHLLDLLDGHAERPLSAYRIVAFAGGFAFGDHLGAGLVFANKIRWRLYDQLIDFIDRGGLALGICNGFQTMVRLGLLPGLDGDYRRPLATLAPNDRLGYRDAWVRLRVDDASPCLWTRGLDEIELPSRHGEGKLITAGPEVDERLAAEHLVPVRYVDSEGRATEAWPDNPNGSPGGAAGLCDPSGRIFGMMPHPDAFLYPFQHPDWFRRSRGTEEPREGAGLAIFRNGVEAAAGL